MANPTTEAFSQAPYARYLAFLRTGQLAYQYSVQAQQPVFYPRVRCPYTGTDRLEWRVSHGVGTVYSTSVVYPRTGEPYNVALIDMDEGFRLMSRVVSIDPTEVAIGQRVVFHSIAEDGLDEPIAVFAIAKPGL